MKQIQSFELILRVLLIVGCDNHIWLKISLKMRKVNTSNTVLIWDLMIHYVHELAAVGRGHVLGHRSELMNLWRIYYRWPPGEALRFRMFLSWGRVWISFLLALLGLIKCRRCLFLLEREFRGFLISFRNRLYHVKLCDLSRLIGPHDPGSHYWEYNLIFECVWF